MKQILLVALGVFGLFAASSLPAFSQSPGTVDAKVTPLVLSVNLSQASVDYGSMPLSLDDGTRTIAASTAIGVTNTGSVTANLMIRGSDAEPANGADATWTLSCDPPEQGTVAQDQFAHRFVKTPGDFTSAQALCSDSDKTLATDVVALTGSIDFRLQMNMPTASTGFSQRTTSVVVTAVQP